MGTEDRGGSSVLAPVNNATVSMGVQTLFQLSGVFFPLNKHPEVE